MKIQKITVSVGIFCSAFVVSIAGSYWIDQQYQKHQTQNLQATLSSPQTRTSLFHQKLEVPRPKEMPQRTGEIRSIQEIGKERFTTQKRYYDGQRPVPIKVPKGARINLRS